jgi:hypothetical protein
MVSNQSRKNEEGGGHAPEVSTRKRLSSELPQYQPYRNEYQSQWQAHP